MSGATSVIVKNAGLENSRTLVSMAPVGFDVFFTRCTKEFAKLGGTDMPHVMVIAAEHGIHLVRD